jgi:hypothetical protein
MVITWGNFGPYFSGTVDSTDTSQEINNAVHAPSEEED